MLQTDEEYKLFVTSLGKRMANPLSREQLAKCMHFCYVNARELYKDAEILLENKRYARAFSLCVLCLEELAKIPLILNGACLNKDDKKIWIKFWKMIHSHQTKQHVWQSYGKSFLPKEMAEIYRYRFPKELPLERLKQIGFYVDFINDEPMIPSIFYLHNQTILKIVFKIAKNRLKGFYPLHSKIEYSQKIIKLLDKVTVSVQCDHGTRMEFSELFETMLKNKAC